MSLDHPHPTAPVAKVMAAARMIALELELQAELDRQRAFVRRDADAPVLPVSEIDAEARSAEDRAA